MSANCRKLYMEEFTLINNKRDRIKIFKPFEDLSKPSPTINAMEIKYALSLIHI